jgi:starch synthase (maltosyl-transferring)
MNQPINILYLINTWVVGGTETQLMSLLRYLDRTRYQPHVCALYRDPEFQKAMAAANVPALCLNIRRVRYPDTVLRLLALARYCRKHRVRIIQGVRTDQLAVVVGRLSGTPVVLGGQRDIQSGDGMTWRRLRTTADHGLTGVIANSAAAADYRTRLSQLPPERMFVVPNGLDLGRFDGEPRLTRAWLGQGVPEQAPLLAILGRLDITTKGHATLLAALAAPGLESCHLLVIGDGQDRALLLNLIAELGLDERVHLLGHRDDVGDVLPLADIVVIASTNESSPNVILEAWAARRAVIATRVGGIPEVVEEGVDGLLTPPSDAPALAEAIRRLLDDPALRRQMAERGRQKAEREFSGPVMAQRLAAIYDALLAPVDRPESVVRRAASVEEHRLP